MDTLNQLKDNIKLLNTHIRKCEKMCNKIKRLLKKILDLLFAEMKCLCKQ